MNRLSKLGTLALSNNLIGSGAGIRRMMRPENENLIRDLFQMPGIPLQGDLLVDGGRPVAQGPGPLSDDRTKSLNSQSDRQDCEIVRMA